MKMPAALPWLVLLAAAPALADERPTIVIHAGDTPVIEAAASSVPALQDLKPGDRLTISVRDRNGERRVLSAVVSGTAAAELARPRAEVRRSDVPVEIVSMSPGTRTLTIRESTGETRTVLMDDRAVVGFRDLGPGDKVLLSWRYTPEGQPEAVFRVDKTTAVARSATPTIRVRGGYASLAPGAGSTATTVRVREGNSYRVVSTDLDFGTLVVRDDLGNEQTLAVDRAAIDRLRRVAPGERVVVLGTGDGDRVVVFTTP
jgi:hypothetical protein